MPVITPAPSPDQEVVRQPNSQAGFLAPESKTLEFKYNTLVLGVNKNSLDLQAIREKAGQDGFDEKDTFHITVIGFKNGTEIKKVFKGLSAEARQAKILEIQTLVDSTDWSFRPEDTKLHVAKEYKTPDPKNVGAEITELRESYIQLMTLPTLINFYVKLNSLLGTNLEPPPAHATLYVSGTDKKTAKKGIGINSAVELAQLNPQPISIALASPAALKNNLPLSPPSPPQAQKLYKEFLPPFEGQPPFRTVMLVNGDHPSGTGSERLMHLTEQLRKQGVGVFRFDFRGAGLSAGDPHDLGSLTQALADYREAASAMLANSQIDQTRMGLWAISFGGSVVCGLPEITNKFKSLFLIAPAADLAGSYASSLAPGEEETWAKEGYSAKFDKNYKVLADAKKYDWQASAAQLKVPTIIVHGTKDTVVPIVQSENLRHLLSMPKNGRPGTDTKLIKLEGEEHWPTDPGWTRIENITEAWATNRDQVVEAAPLVKQLPEKMPPRPPGAPKR